MKAFHKKRLLKLVELLEKLPRKRFDYDHWVGSDWKGKPDLSCGTTACAFGWATTIPSFRKAGLHLQSGYDYTDVIFKGRRGFWAASEFFGLSEEEAENLFSPEGSAYYMIETPFETPSSYLKDAPGSDATPKQVAKHIRRFLKWKEKNP